MFNQSKVDLKFMKVKILMLTNLKFMKVKILMLTNPLSPLNTGTGMGFGSVQSQKETPDPDIKVSPPSKNSAECLCCGYCIRCFSTPLL